MSDPTLHERIIYFTFSLLFLLFSTGCENDKSNNDWKTTGSLHPEGTHPDELTLTIGDIDPDTPRLRMLKLRPLASHMARELGWKDSQIKIRIVKSIEEAASLISTGEIDLFMDSSYPSMLVQQLSNAQIILEIPVQGKRSYKSLILASKKSEIKSLDDLDDKTISLQELYSTSGF